MTNYEILYRITPAVVLNRSCENYYYVMCHHDLEGWIVRSILRPVLRRSGLQYSGLY